MNQLLRSLVSHFALGFQPPASVGSDRTPADAATVTLAGHQWRSIANPLGMVIDCVRGRAVLTQEGDTADHLLVTGESCDVTRDAHLYVQAERESELRFAMMMVTIKPC